MSKRLLPAERRRQIQNHLVSNNVAWTSALGELLAASPATIRRDLKWLEEQGVVERTHGGAILTQRIVEVPTFSSRAQTYPEEKRSIAIVAAALVAKGDTIFLNIGTTVTQVALQLLSRPSLSNLTIFTNNLIAAMELKDSSFEVVLLGGSIRSRSEAAVGPIAIEHLRNVNGSKSFIGVSGISTKYGLTQPYYEEAAIDRLMIQQTRGPVIVVADHSKWGVVSNFQISAIEQVDMLITDPGLPPAARLELEARSVEVIIAGQDSPALDNRLSP